MYLLSLALVSDLFLLAQSEVFIELMLNVEMMFLAVLLMLSLLNTSSSEIKESQFKSIDHNNMIEI